MSEKGQAAFEYVALLGMVAAASIAILSFFYSGDDVESMIAAWGDALAQQVAGDRIGAGGGGSR